ncbi:MAG: hypothetical protein JXJ04_05590 [Spirochaetales bacterium]|nr:hypothetical protein [Spirochaetales bacterium]
MCKNRIIKNPHTSPFGIFFLTVIFLFLFILCTGCKNDKDLTESGDESKTQFWYVLNNGTVEEVSGITDRGAASLLPWTIQERITDIALYHQNLYFLVNGSGLFTISSEEDNHFIIKTLYDPGYFEYKTVTSIMPFHISGNNDGIVCHLYFNSMIFPFPIDDSLYDNANLITLTPSENRLFIEELYPLTPEQEPHWEIVRMLPVNKDSLYLEWKNSQKSYSEFKYSCYSVTRRNDREIQWQEFLAAYGFISISDKKTPEQLRLLCERVIRDSLRQKKETTFHFFVEDKESHVTTRYIKKASVPMTDADFEIITVKIFKDEKGYYALVDSGFIYYIKAGNNNIRKISLPSLPVHFHYTDFFIMNNSVFMAWEESLFVNVGVAGLLILKDTPL